jgi:putative inorganic carbon (HCO3(-)) transporter
VSGVLGTGLGVYIPFVIYAAVLITTVLSLAGKPSFSVFLLVLLIPLQTTRAKLIPLPFGAHAIDILWSSAFVGILLHHTRPYLPKARIGGLLLAFGFMCYLSLWQGWFLIGGEAPLYVTNQRFSDWKNYMVMPVLTFVVSACIKTTRQIKILITIMFLATIVVNWSFIRSTSGRDLSHFSYNVRDAGVLGYAGENGLGAFVAQIIVLFFALALFIRRKICRLALGAIIAFSAYSLLFSFSRGGYISCLLGISVVSIFRQPKVLVIVLALLIGWQTLLPKAVQERIDMTYDENGGVLDSSAEERITLWKDALSLIGSNPVFGYGFDTYQFMERVGSYSDTHNYYLKVTVEMGFVGLSMLIAILFKMWSFGLRLFRYADEPFLQALGLGFAAMILCIAVANFFGDRWTFLQVDGYLWVLLGCVMRALDLARERPGKRPHCEAIPMYADGDQSLALT